MIFGDIIFNTFASNDNPNNVVMFLRHDHNNGEIVCIAKNGDFVRFNKYQQNRDKFLKVVGRQPLLNFSFLQQMARDGKFDCIRERELPL